MLAVLCASQVIEALANPKKPYVPFRSHVLTRILRGALGGNCRSVPYPTVFMLQPFLAANCWPRCTFAS